MLIVAGLLVGIGTRIGKVRSGHGVAGRRVVTAPLVATLTFMAAGIATVAIMNAWAEVLS